MRPQTKTIGLAIVGALIVGTIVWSAALWAYNDAVDNQIETGGERVTLYIRTLRAALSRYAYLPFVLSRSNEVRDLLAGAGSSDGTNYYLESLNLEAGSEALYVMDANGDTLAASNWRDSLTYAGQNYGFRPYFLSAKAGHRGWYFGIGATTGHPGYFMSYPVSIEDAFAGAVVVKVDLAPLQDDWHEGGETVLVSDNNGVVFLSSRNEWHYRTMSPLTESQTRHILATKQYGQQALELLPFRNVRSLGEGQRIVRMGRKNYLVLSREVEERGWHIHQLLPLAIAEERQKLVLIIGTVLSLLFLATGMYLRERRQKKISRQKAQDAEVIRAVNVRLQAEIEERVRTEQALRDTQNELVQTGKLAALGHMAAGIVHELNQPISAIRTHAASCRLLLDREQVDKVRETLKSITRITEHMASITMQLKSFAHNSPKLKEKVCLQDCLEDVVIMVQPLLKEHQVGLAKECPEEPLIIYAERGKIKQVLVNLLTNAIDAMRGRENKHLRVTMRSEAGQVIISVRDSGPGIGPDVMDDIFTPFVTTKDVGEGLGLGLSITYRIISDLGGTIKANNPSDGGACMQVRLPRASEESDL